MNDFNTLAAFGEPSGDQVAIRVLVVEDEVLITLETGRIVEDVCQAVVEFATNPADAGLVGRIPDLAALSVTRLLGS